MKLRLPFPITPKGWTRRRRAKETDYGRTFGWFVEKGKERLGELEYIRWDSFSQFWHEYRVTWEKEEAQAFEQNPDAWIESHLSLRNRRYQQVVVTGFLTAPRTAGVIAVRSAFVPEDQL